MSKYPVFLAGRKLTAAMLTAGQWDTTRKENITTKVNATLANDTELAGISLGVGTWEIVVMIFCSNPTSATPDLKTQWSFTGTWNTPLRHCEGPSSTNVSGSDVLTPMKFRAAATNADSAYGLNASTAYTTVEERCAAVVVTVAGTWALSWAQNSLDAANGTAVNPGSYVKVRQIA